MHRIEDSARFLVMTQQLVGWLVVLTAVAGERGLLGASPAQAQPKAGTVTGTVRLDGPPPKPKTWDLEPVMQKAGGQKTYTEERWLVGKATGLANCVVTLKAKDPAARVAPNPLENAVFA